jgi:antitoxin component of RelBE/YafQ-DinJ toxin-antitoxin module
MAKRKVNEKERVNFLIDKSAYEEFSRLCEELGYVRSKQIELFMKRMVEENQEILKKVKSK